MSETDYIEQLKIKTLALESKFLKRFNTEDVNSRGFEILTTYFKELENWKITQGSDENNEAYWNMRLRESKECERHLKYLSQEKLSKFYDFIFMFFQLGVLIGLIFLIKTFPIIITIAGLGILIFLGLFILGAILLL